MARILERLLLPGNSELMGDWMRELKKGQSYVPVLKYLTTRMQLNYT